MKPCNEETEEGEEAEENNTVQSYPLEGQADSEQLEDPTLKEQEVHVLIILCTHINIYVSACVTHIFQYVITESHIFTLLLVQFNV